MICCIMCFEQTWWT